VKKVWRALGGALEAAAAVADVVDVVDVVDGVDGVAGAAEGAALATAPPCDGDAVALGLAGCASVAPCALAAPESGDNSSWTMALHLGVGLVALSFAPLQASSSPLIR